MLYPVPDSRAGVVTPAIPGWAAAWFAPALDWLEANLLDDFPCYFARNAWNAGTLIATEIALADMDRFVADLREFVAVHAALPYRSALVAYWESGSDSLEEDERMFWALLKAIELRSRTPADSQYDDPSWRFVFDDAFLFATGHSPFFESRCSRLSRPFPMMVIQTYDNLRQVADTFPTLPSVANRIRTSVDRYDRICHAPAFDRAVPDWQQFWLPDHNGEDKRSCPLAGSSKSEG